MEQQLEDLARDWDVTVQYATGGNFVVTIHARRHLDGATPTHVYSDPSVARAIARAWAGERGDNVRY